ENLGKLQSKADIGIFIGYAPTKKAFWIYNRRTRRIVETIHVDFNELTVIASEQSSPGPALNEMTYATISSGLVQKPSSSTQYVPPTRNDWDLLFQPMFDELLNPPPSVYLQAPDIIAPIVDVIPPVQAESTGLPSSTSVDQDAPSLSKSQTTPETQSSVIPQDVEEDNLDIEVAHIGNDPLFLEPKTYKDALTQSCWIEAMQEELNEFERLEGVYVSQPDGFVDQDNPNHLYKLKKTLYGLKQALRTWYDMLLSFLLSQDFSKGSVDPTLFIRRNGNDLLLKYGFESCDPVDTPMVEKSKLDEDKEGKSYQARPTEKHAHAVKRIFRYLRGTVHQDLWYPKDSFVALTTFADADHAGCQDTHRSTSDSSASLCQTGRGTTSSSSFTTQRVLVTTFVRFLVVPRPVSCSVPCSKKYGFESCDPVDTPMVEKSKLDEDKEGKSIDLLHYRDLIGTLFYLTASRPDLQFAICMCAQYQARPTEKHAHAVKRIFRYLRGTIHRDLWYPKDSFVALTTFADADHAGCQDTRRSTSGSAISGRKGL
nr:uncharacterized mitochondrial protein AtMg00810-like [Tanacetum cinerariifolium]